MASSDAVMKVAAMGRPFTLGMMYDARTEQLVPGISLWDPQVLAKNTVEGGKPSSQFQVLASDTLESKSSLLDIDASLKASFLGGLIEVSGSAKYLNDYKKFKNQCRCTFQYQASTVFRQLSLGSLAPLDDRQREIIDMNLATHVVTGIVYGANAFFVFDSEKLESSNVQNIQGQINAVMKKIPSFDIEGKVDIKMTEEEKKVTNKFSCTFYGDVFLESNPATFVDAVTTYVNLPKLLRENKDAVAPLVVWMLPLVTLYPKAPVVPKGISIPLARKAAEVIEDLKLFQSACNEAQSEVVSQTFPDLGRVLLRFNNLCGYYIEFLQRALSTKLPKIRDGSVDEKELMQLFQERDTSPFSHEKLSQWMTSKLREVTVMQSIVDMMAGTNVKLVQSQSELDKEILDANVHDALCYVFTSLEITHPQLDDMVKYLDSSRSLALTNVPWYFSATVLSNMKEKAKNFCDLAAALKESKGVKFFMVALPNDKYKGASIYHYQSGALVSDNFSRPVLPDRPENITDKQALMWYAADLTFNVNTANKFIILSHNNKKATCGEGQSYPDLPERFDGVRQVICNEGLTDRAYWEVEWSDGVEDDIAIGVTYKNIDRKDDTTSWFGNNPVSWCFGKFNPRTASFTGHNNEWVETPLPSTGVNRVGVFLDWPGGTLSFYKVSSDKLTLLSTFQANFTAPVFPGCYLKYERSFIYFCPVE
ncbi:neoverrucotoxin subunit alpha-like [Synchiropus splendidus]|uniref:neoverrucotoxin subunit alpha-like n=1 Tax=Synchiropus splendidus TaxID=270530 RepID=UPI00237EDB0B|nr:neoverrucotoxin subunit alpha-like [Synchiropus splendidus]